MHLAGELKRHRRRLLGAELRNKIVYVLVKYLRRVYNTVYKSKIAFMYVEHPVLLPFIVNLKLHFGITIHFVKPGENFSAYDRVIIPNGQWDNVRIATNGIPENKRVYLEIGFFPQTKNVYFDPKGVHGHSSLRDIALAPLTTTEQEELELLRADFAKTDFVRIKWDSIDISHASAGNDRNDYNFDFVFVPLQLERDTAFELCPFNDNQEIVSHIESSLPGKKIIFKPHPLDTNPLYQVSATNIMLPTSNKDLRTLITSCSAVVASNSTVILESLLLEKKCATLGVGFTTNHDIVLECHENLGLLAKIDEWNPPKEKIDSFLYALFQRQIPIDFYESSRERSRVLEQLKDFNIV